MIRVNVVPNDIKTVAKAILINSQGKVLFLKRSKYVKKYAGEWDLPGGHLKQGERIESGLVREIKEETGLKVTKNKLLKVVGNMYYFLTHFEESPVKLSHEHVEYKFFTKNELDLEEKFQKIAFDAMERTND